MEDTSNSDLIDTKYHSLIKQRLSNNHYMCVEHPELDLIHQGLVTRHLAAHHGVLGETPKSIGEKIKDASDLLSDPTKEDLIRVIEDMSNRAAAEEGAKLSSNHRLIYGYLEARRIHKISPTVSYADWLEMCAIAWLSAFGIQFITRVDESNFTPAQKVYSDAVSEEWAAQT